MTGTISTPAVRVTTPPGAHGRSPAGRPRPAIRRGRAAAVLLAPFAVLFGAVFVLPVGYAVWQSLFTVRRSGLGLGPPETVFAGWGNYARVFADDAFLAGVGRVIAFGLVQVPVMLGLALLLALLLDSGAARLGRVFRLAYFLPFAIPGVIAAILWSFLYVPGLTPLDIGVDFLAADTVLFSIGNIVTWSWTGYNMLILYTALQSIPRELYEAAAMDGCSAWRIAWHVKVPLLRPALTLTGVFSVIGTLQLFGEPMVLKHMTSAVGNSYTPVMLSYQAAFGLNDYHFAAAVAVVLAVATFVLSYGFLRLASRGES